MRNSDCGVRNGQRADRVKRGNPGEISCPAMLFWQLSLTTTRTVIVTIADQERQSESSLTLDDLRRFAVARSLFAPTTLRRAIARMGFAQADPIRAAGEGT